MTSRDFAFWLKGYFEIEDQGPKVEQYALTHTQIKMIHEHLNLVFKHDPSIASAPTPRQTSQMPNQQLNQMNQGTQGQHYADLQTGAIC